ncbi:hypothetical protein DSO57_1027720 [Entomophthora muscae]|uniref:Uncharacterized protein n=1 Tax=Entomophthora muscae TaxID=34485 RepID=A0ACC2U059_9FUNG|nr:hypothetical protein DSO57_1027720 [Entomophthora muscae]
MLSLVSAYSFEYLMSRPRPSLESFRQVERNGYFAKIRQFNDPKGTQNETLLSDLLDMLETQPLNFLALPAWNGMFLLHAEALLNVVIPSWDWTKPSSIWIFKPMLTSCFRVPITHSNGTQCQQMIYPNYSKNLYALQNSNLLDYFGLNLAGLMQTLSHHFATGQSIASFYHNPLILNVLSYNDLLFCNFLSKYPKSINVPGIDAFMSAWNITIKQAIQKIQTRCHP